MTSPRIPEDWSPLIIWSKYFYKQQRDFTNSDAWQRWFIGGNGTGKTLIAYWNVVAYALGIHPRQFAPPPLRVQIIVPDFDKVTDTALEKLQLPQVIISKDKHGKRQSMEVGPLLPPSMCVPKRGFTKDHRGIDLKNGSSISWVTTAQGWMSMRGPEFDILLVDEECGEREFDENVRGLRNAKGGGRILGALTPPYEEGHGPTWTKEKVLEASYDTDPKELQVFSACMADNPAITKEFIERFSKGKTQKMIKVQVYGEYPTWGDLVYPFFEDRLWDIDAKRGHLLPGHTPIPENRDVKEWVMSFDWHQSKACAALWGFIDHDDNIVIFDELPPEAASGKTIGELSEMFKNIEGTHSRRRFRRWQDPSAKHKYNAHIRGYNAWDEFRKNEIITSSGQNRNPEVGIGIVNEYFKGDTTDHPRLFIYENCKNLRRFLGNHFWKRREDGRGEPDPKWSDFPVCLRYIVEAIGSKSGGDRKRWPLTSYQTVQPKRPTIDVSRWMQ